MSIRVSQKGSLFFCARFSIECANSRLGLIVALSRALSVDDGTGIVPVHCAAPPSATTATGGTGSRQPFLPPLDASSSSASTIAATTLQQRQREAQRLAIERQFVPLQEAAEKWGDRTVLPAGRLVRVVGRVEEPRSLRDQGRRIAASLVGESDPCRARDDGLYREQMMAESSGADVPCRAGRRRERNVETSFRRRRITQGRVH